MAILAIFHGIYCSMKPDKHVRHHVLLCLSVLDAYLFFIFYLFMHIVITPFRLQNPIRPTGHVFIVVVCFCNVNKTERIGACAQSHVLQRA